MLIKETKIASDDTNTRARGQPKRRVDVSAVDGEGLQTGDGCHAENILRHSRGCDHSRVFGVRAQSNATSRGRCAVGDRQGRSRRCAAPGRRLPGEAVALYGSQLPARYAQPARNGPRSALCVDGHARRASSAVGQARGRRESGQAGDGLALARTRICSLPWYSPAGGERQNLPPNFFVFLLFAFYAPA